jgi:exodeoxyribonuclease V alpha subunit
LSKPAAAGSTIVPTAKRAERVIAGWDEQRIIREIMLFLHSNGVGTSRAVRIYKTYGADAVQLISENPYRLARDIRGISFHTADQIAAKLGIEKTALIRVRAGVSFALAEAMDDGHCGLPHEDLLALTRELLEVPAELVETALGLELRDGTAIGDNVESRALHFSRRVVPSRARDRREVEGAQSRKAAVAVDRCR